MLMYPFVCTESSVAYAAFPVLEYKVAVAFGPVPRSVFPKEICDSTWNDIFLGLVTFCCMTVQLQHISGALRAFQVDKHR